VPVFDHTAYPPGLLAFFVFLFGLCIGSFLNVCIRRIPSEEGLSIVRPASRCPACKTPIKPYDNIPILSFLLLGGKCRSCRAPISALYPAVELLTGAMFLICVLTFGPTLDAIKWAVFTSVLIVLVFTDILERILPDAVNFTGLGAGLLFSCFTAPMDTAAGWICRRLFEFPPPAPALNLVDALLGAAAGSGLLWVVADGYFRLRGRQGMGLGDVKMMAMVGGFLGPQRTVLTILVGSLLGSLLGGLFILLRSKGTEYELPFGAFLGAAALLVLFWGRTLIDWYLRLSGLA